MKSTAFLLLSLISSFALAQRGALESTSTANDNHLPTINLHPTIHNLNEQDRFSKIPLDLIKNFLAHPALLAEKQIATSPQIIAGAKNTYFYTIGDRIFARDLKKPGRYLIFRNVGPIIDPDTGKSLGEEVAYVGEAKTLEPRNPKHTITRNKKAEKELPENERYSKAYIFGKRAPSFMNIPTRVAFPLVITHLVGEISSGDRLLPLNENVHEQLNFVPHAGPPDFKARIVHAFASIDNQELAKYQSVVINGGSKDGLDRGSVLAVYDKLPNSVWMDNQKRGHVVYKNIAYPTTYVGKILIYDLSEDLAYGIVLSTSNQAYMKIGNWVTARPQDLEDIPDYEPHSIQ